MPPGDFINLITGLIGGAIQNHQLRRNVQFPGNLFGGGGIGNLGFGGFPGFGGIPGFGNAASPQGFAFGAQQAGGFPMPQTEATLFARNGFPSGPQAFNPQPTLNAFGGVAASPGLLASPYAAPGGLTNPNANLLGNNVQPGIAGIPQLLAMGTSPLGNISPFFGGTANTGLSQTVGLTGPANSGFGVPFFGGGDPAQLGAIQALTQSVQQLVGLLGNGFSQPGGFFGGNGLPPGLQNLSRRDLRRLQRQQGRNGLAGLNNLNGINLNGLNAGGVGGQNRGNSLLAGLLGGQNQNGGQGQNFLGQLLGGLLGRG